MMTASSGPGGPKRSKPDGIPSDLATTKNHSPCQPKLSHFPLSTIAGKQRSFDSSWYSSYSWPEYSIQQDACMLLLPMPYVSC